MKRSEALGLILEKIYSWHTSLGTDYEIPDWFMANEILTLLEEDIGMNPPYDSTSDDEDPNYCWEPEE